MRYYCEGVKVMVVGEWFSVFLWLWDAFVRVVCESAPGS